MLLTHIPGFPANTIGEDRNRPASRKDPDFHEKSYR